MKQETPKTFKELFANTGIEPITDESGNIQYNFKATMKEETKQETTLEEVAEKEASLFYEKGSLDWNKYRQVFIEGAKWQQERSYSEEDIREAFLAGVDKESYRGLNFDEWFEQFKKK
jgi:hypothetical protein